MVSVPSRGLCFQSSFVLHVKRGKNVFPSPLGDYVFNRCKFERRKPDGVFPSPLGDYVFNRGALVCTY